MEAFLFCVLAFYLQPLFCYNFGLLIEFIYAEFQLILYAFNSCLSLLHIFGLEDNVSLEGLSSLHEHLDLRRLLVTKGFQLNDLI